MITMLAKGAIPICFFHGFGSDEFDGHLVLEGLQWSTYVNIYITMFVCLGMSNVPQFMVIFETETSEPYNFENDSCLLLPHDGHSCCCKKKRTCNELSPSGYCARNPR